MTCEQVEGPYKGRHLSASSASLDLLVLLEDSSAGSLGRDRGNGLLYDRGLDAARLEDFAVDSYLTESQRQLQAVVREIA